MISGLGFRDVGFPGLEGEGGGGLGFGGGGGGGMTIFGLRTVAV